MFNRNCVLLLMCWFLHWLYFQCAIGCWDVQQGCVSRGTEAQEEVPLPAFSEKLSCSVRKHPETENKDGVCVEHGSKSVKMHLPPSNEKCNLLFVRINCCAIIMILLCLYYWKSHGALRSIHYGANARASLDRCYIFSF